MYCPSVVAGQLLSLFSLTVCKEYKLKLSMLPYVFLTRSTDIDFPQQVVKLAFYENVTEACGCIIVTDDSILEEDEEFYVTLGTTDPAVSFDAMEAAAIQIIDDDGKQVESSNT